MTSSGPVEPREVAAQRIALGIEYDGSAFSGWQAQRSPALPTVQESLERALSRVAAHPVATRCAGRTDAGVHATAQVVHFDTTAVRTERSWVLGANSLLPPDVAVQWARPVAAGFDARHSALYRRYHYRILNRPTRSALLARRACLWRHPLDAQAMHDAAQALLGERDFSAFRAAGCQSRTPMRRVEAVSVTRQDDALCIDIRANAFLLHMVRNIAGALLVVGSGEQPVAWIAELLAARDRRLAAATAPPQGLFLVEVGYAPHWGLPEARPRSASVIC